MMTDSQHVKIYFEEIPAHEDGDSEVILKEGVESVHLKDGGELQNVQFGDIDLGREEELEEFESKGSLHETGECSGPPITGTTAELSCKLLCGHEGSGLLPASCGSGSICQLGEHIILFGGASRTQQHFDQLWTFSVRENKWSKFSANQVLGTPPSPRSGHSMCPLDSRHMVLFGGMNLSQQTWFDDTHVLRITETKSSDGRIELFARWLAVRLKGEHPQARAEHSLSSLDSETVLLFGGSCGAHGVLSDVQMLRLSVGEGGVPEGTRDEGTGPGTSEGALVTASWTRLRCTGTFVEPRELHTATVVPSLCKQVDGGPRELQNSLHSLYEDDTVSDSAVNTEEASKRKAQGNRLFIAKKYAEALEEYSLSLQHDPRASACLGNRSACYLQLHQPSLALDDAITSVRVSPNWAKGYFREYNALLALGRIDEALHAIQAAVELASTDSEMSQFLQVKQELLSRKREESVHEEPLNDSVGPFLLIYGGRGESGLIGDVHALDLGNNKWKKLSKSPFPRCGHSIGLKENRWLYAFGGLDQSMQIQSSSVVFDIYSGMWAECHASTATPSERFAHASCCATLSKEVIRSNVENWKEGCFPSLLDDEDDSHATNSENLQSTVDAGENEQAEKTIKQRNASEIAVMLIYGGVNLNEDLGDLWILALGDVGDCI